MLGTVPPAHVQNPCANRWCDKPDNGIVHWLNPRLGNVVESNIADPVEHSCFYKSLPLFYGVFWSYSWREAHTDTGSSCTSARPGAIRALPAEPGGYRREIIEHVNVFRPAAKGGLKDIAGAQIMSRAGGRQAEFVSTSKFVASRSRALENCSSALSYRPAAVSAAASVQASAVPLRRDRIAEASPSRCMRNRACMRVMEALLVACISPGSASRASVSPRDHGHRAFHCRGSAWHLLSGVRRHDPRGAETPHDSARDQNGYPRTHGNAAVRETTDQHQ